MAVSLLILTFILVTVVIVMRVIGFLIGSLLS